MIYIYIHCIYIRFNWLLVLLAPVGIRKWHHGWVALQRMLSPYPSLSGDHALKPFIAYPSQISWWVQHGWAEAASGPRWGHYQCRLRGYSMMIKYWQKCTHYSDVIYNERLDCLLNHLFNRKSKKTSKLHWPLWGESIGDQWIPLTKATKAENVSIWWRLM